MENPVQKINSKVCRQVASNGVLPRVFLDAMILGIGGEMLAEFEDGFVVVMRTYSAGELR
jgi:hypothetical protein